MTEVIYHHLECNFLDSDAVQYWWLLPTFWRTILPPSSGWGHGVTTQKTLTWIFIAMKTSSLTSKVMPPLSELLHTSFESFDRF